MSPDHYDHAAAIRRHAHNRGASLRLADALIAAGAKFPQAYSLIESKVDTRGRVPPSAEAAIFGELMLGRYRSNCNV